MATRLFRGSTWALLCIVFAAGTPPTPERPSRPLPRVVSLIPAASAFLVELDAAGAVVGRSSDDRTAGLEDVPEVGRVLDPDPESLVALQPDVVVVWADQDLRPLRRAAELAGAELLPLRFDRLGDLDTSLPRLGEAVDRGPEARRLLGRLRAGLDSVAREARHRPSADVLWVAWPDPPVVAGPGTLPQDLLEVVGARNVMEGSPAAWPRPSHEWLIAREPELVVWPVGPGQPPVAELPPGSPWHALPALRRGRVLEADLDLMHEVGPRVVEAARTLSLALDALP